MTPPSPDINISRDPPIRAPSSVPVDDAVLPFEVASLDLRGRLTRLGPALDDVLTKHDYPAAVGKLLGEAIVLTTLLGSSLKFDGRFILQTQTDGPVSFLIVDFQAPDRLRAYARYDARRLKPGADSGALLGKGHLAMTIDQGPDMSRFHGGGVLVVRPLDLHGQWACRREPVSAMLNGFEARDRAEMVKDGKVVVTCEFCSSVYEFTPQEAGVEEA